MSDDKKEKDNDLEKGFKQNLAGVATFAALTAADIPKPAPVPEASIEQQKSQEGPRVELRPELKSIAHIESSDGKNKDHKRTTAGLNAGDKAAGSTGMMPLMAKETINKVPALKSKYDHLTYLPNDALTEHLNKNPDVEAEIANHHWSRLDRTFGSDQARKAYAWRKGISAAKSATDEQVASHPYVKKFMKLRGMNGNIDRYVASNEVTMKSENQDKDLEKMSRPKITFPNLPKLSTRPDSDVQVVETQRQKEIYGRKVANADLKDVGSGETFRLHGSRKVHDKKSAVSAYSDRITGRFGRNTLGMEVPTKAGPKSAALGGALRSKFEDGGEEHEAKLKAHAEKKAAKYAEFSQQSKQWRQKAFELHEEVSKHPFGSDERATATQAYRDHINNKPKKPRVPTPAKKKVATKDLSPDQMKARGRAVDATIHHEGFHHTMENLERHYGKDAARKVHQGLLSHFDKGTLTSVGGFINQKLGYNPRSPKFTEEILAHSRDILVNPAKRERYKKFAGADADKHIKNIKQGHQKAYEYAKKLKPEDLDIKKSELSKGSRQSKLGNPKKKITDNEIKAMDAWANSGNYSDSKNRDLIPESHPEAKARFIQKLHSQTEVRVNKDGEREFLMHRGVKPEQKDFHQTGKLSSWTPKYDKAKSFAELHHADLLSDIEYGYRDDLKDKIGSIKPEVKSAWIPESAIHNYVPNHIKDSQQHDEYGHEQEYIVKPHNFKYANPANLKNDETVDRKINQRADKSLEKTASIGHAAGLNAPGSLTGAAALQGESADQKIIENKPFAQKGNAQKMKARLARIKAAKEMKDKNPEVDWEKHLMLKDEETIEMPKDEFIEEHKNLINVLNSPSHKDDKKEAKKQKKELDEHIKKAISEIDELEKIENELK